MGDCRLVAAILTPNLSEFFERMFFGGFVMYVLWSQVHNPPPRDRWVRHFLPMAAILATLILIHLPRMDGVVAWVVTAPPAPDVRLPDTTEIARLGRWTER